MIAVWLRQFGGPELLVAEETPDPVAGPGQALLRVRFASVAFIETRLRAGDAGPYRLELPAIPGNGVGGVVAAVGPGTDDAWVDRRVVASTGGSGGYAELVVVAVDALIPVPDGLGLDDAVAMLADGRTAMMLMATGVPRTGERVLVEAAGGGVGTLLIQLAKAAGATAVAAAGGTEKLRLARSLGADFAVDYRADDWAAQVRDRVGGLDVVFDGVGGGIASSSFELLDRGGRMVTFGLASGTWAEISDEIVADRGVTVMRPPRPAAAQARTYSELALTEVAAGRLRPVIGQRFPPARAAEAHAAIEGRATTGRTLLDMSS